MKIEKHIPAVSQGNTNSDDLLQQGLIQKLIQKANSIKSPLSSNNQIFFQGKDIKTIIQQEARTNPQLLSQIAHELQKFKDKLRNKKQGKNEKSFFQFAPDTDEEQMLSLCEIYLSLIAEKLKVRYDRTKSGMQIEMDEEGQLILNGINVTMLIAQCRQHSTPQSRIYLKGMSNRLGLLLGNRDHSHLYERIHDVIKSHQLAIQNILRETSYQTEYASY